MICPRYRSMRALRQANSPWLERGARHKGSVPAPPLQPAPNSIPVPGYPDWYYDSTTGTAWRRGSGGGEHNLTGGGGRSNITDFPVEFQNAAKEGSLVVDRLFHPEKYMPQFEMPEIVFPEFPKIPTASELEVERAQAAEKKRLMGRRSRGRSVLTGSTGLTEPAPTNKKQLLGE